MVNEAPPVTDEELDRQQEAETHGEQDGLTCCEECGMVPEMDGGHAEECPYWGGDKRP